MRLCLEYGMDGDGIQLGCWVYRGRVERWGYFGAVRRLSCRFSGVAAMVAAVSTTTASQHFWDNTKCKVRALFFGI